MEEVQTNRRAGMSIPLDKLSPEVLDNCTLRSPPEIMPPRLVVMGVKRALRLPVIGVVRYPTLGKNNRPVWAYTIERIA